MTASVPLPVSLGDYEELARARLPPMVAAYVNGGAADEITLRENRAAFDRLKLATRTLRDMRGAGTGLSLLGMALDHPILIAPVAYHRLVHPEGERATAEGAGAARTAMVVSTQASLSLEDVAAAASAPLLFQLYIQPDRGFTHALAARAEAAGYRALMVTVDAPASLRNREQRAAFRLPPGIEAVNLRGMPPQPAQGRQIGQSPLFSGFLDNAATWEDISRLRDATTLPLILKGILSPQDAREAIARGADAIAVSNHGGRVLDTLPATIEALPRIADAISGAVPLLLDGGIRRGTDIVKALALGASAVMVGRPILHALAAGGAPGVAHALHLLRAELEVAMALTGAPRLKDVGPQILW